MVLFHLFPLNSTFSLAYSFFSFCSVFYNGKCQQGSRKKCGVF
ncbi:hypothetical protein CF65_02148 [Aggregatibacter actinomycetemcomitans HK1651]|nr:hypothetical protein CF65_02148 [Aggregatibacter actinomycetemcomitans HK1651]